MLQYKFILIQGLFLLICTTANAMKSYIELGKLIASKKIKATISGTGGHKENCIQVEIKNNTQDSVFCEVEAGHRFEPVDTAQQDILIVKSKKIKIGPLATITSKLFGFCCQSHDASPKLGSKFNLGKLATGKLLELAQMINRNNFNSEGLQSAVWAVSNNHATSSIPQKNKRLLDSVCKLLGKPIPDYQINYQESSTGTAFSNIPTTVQAELKYKINSASEASAVIKNAQGIVVHRFFEEVPKTRGSYTLSVNASIVSWPAGKYNIQVFSDNGNILAQKTFEIIDNRINR